VQKDGRNPRRGEGSRSDPVAASLKSSGPSGSDRWTYHGLGPGRLKVARQITKVHILSVTIPMKGGKDRAATKENPGRDGRGFLLRGSRLIRSVRAEIRYIQLPSSWPFRIPSLLSGS
jgi:hypothetical protein